MKKKKKKWGEVKEGREENLGDFIRKHLGNVDPDMKRAYHVMIRDWAPFCECRKAISNSLDELPAQPLHFVLWAMMYVEQDKDDCSCLNSVGCWGRGFLGKLYSVEISFVDVSKSTASQRQAMVLSMSKLTLLISCLPSKGSSSSFQQWLIIFCLTGPEEQIIIWSTGQIMTYKSSMASHENASGLFYSTSLFFCLCLCFFHLFLFFLIYKSMLTKPEWRNS